jgi:hypothetical protein
VVMVFGVIVLVVALAAHLRSIVRLRQDHSMEFSVARAVAFDAG